MVDNEPMVDLYAANAAAPRPHAASTPTATTAVVGSTDMGNVSYLVPVDPPDDRGRAAGVAIHTPEFAEHARSPRATRPCSTGPRRWP